jgi:hypothetical protein
MCRVLILGLVMVLSALAMTTTPSLAQSGARINVLIYRYGGASQSQAHEVAFERFIDMVQDRLLSLSGELSGLGGNLAYLHDLQRSVVTQNGQPIEFNGSLSDLKKHWSQGQTLAVLTGQIGEHAQKFRVRSRIFLGDLKGALPREDIVVDLEFDINDFEPASDTHAVAAIYALAMDARRRGLPRDAILRLLNRAKQYARGIDDHLAGIAQLKAAITQSLSDAKAVP